MNSRTLKESFIRVIILLIGLIIAHLGVTLFLLSNMGSDPFNVLIQGLFRSLQGVMPNAIPFTHGITHMSISLLIIGVLLFVDKSYVKIGTLLCMICGGPIIDFFTFVLGGVVNDGLPYAIRIIILAVGCIILAYGMTIVIKSDSGTGPNDLVAIVISDKLKKRFSITRIIVDVCFVIIGYILGGVFGLGTIICAALVGPVAGVFLPKNETIINNIVKRLL